MARGSARGCNMALRPQGRATAGPREAHVVLTRGRRPHRWVHVGARVGRHMAGKDGNRRAHGYSGALVRVGGGNAIDSQLRPLIEACYFHFCLPCGTMFPCNYLLQVMWRKGVRWMRSERRRLRGPESTRSSIRHVR